MPHPKAICLEDLGATTESDRYLQCSLRVGRSPGLRIGARGDISWLGTTAGCELWVSADDQVIAYRPPGAPTVRVHRSGRSVDAPEARPTVLLDQDELEVGGKRLRVHIHGDAPSVAPPMAVAGTSLPTPAPTPLTPPEIAVRERPPSVAVMPPRPEIEIPPAMPTEPGAQPSTKRWWHFWK